MKKVFAILICFSVIFTLLGCKKNNGTSDINIEYVTVAYEADGDGSFVGERVQIIEKGSYTTQITAVAEEGWEFIGWDDGYESASRSDKGVAQDTVYTAIFVPAEQDEGDAPDIPSDIPTFPGADE